MIQKAFEIGNSVALTIPKKVGIKPGTRVTFRQEDNKLVYEIIKRKPLSIEEQIKRTSGTFDVKVPNLKQVLKYLEENPYDKDTRFP